MSQIIIAGCGRVGENTALMLNDRGHNVTVVDNNDQTCERMEKTLVNQVLNYNVTKEDLYQNLDLENADHFLALTDNQDSNVSACQMAKEKNEFIHTVARRTKKAQEIKASNGIDHVVYPEEHGARSLTNLTTEHEFRTLENIEGEIEIIEILVQPDSPVANKQLSEVMIPSGTTVISDDKNNEIADGDTVLEPDRTYLLAAKTNMTDDIKKLFHN